MRQVEDKARSASPLSVSYSRGPKHPEARPDSCPFGQIKNQAASALNTQGHGPMCVPMKGAPGATIRIFGQNLVFTHHAQSQYALYSKYANGQAASRSYIWPVLYGWARITIEPTKSCSLSFQDWARNDLIYFKVDGERIHCWLKDLSKAWEGCLWAKEDWQEPPSREPWGLVSSIQLYQPLIWLLKLCEVTTCTVLRTDTEANNLILKLLGLP